MHFQIPDDVQQMQRTLRRFMDEEILPRNAEYEDIAASGRFPLEVVEPLKRHEREAGLWTRAELAKTKEHLGATAAYLRAH